MTATTPVRQVALAPGALTLNNAALYVALSPTTVQMVGKGEFPRPRRPSGRRVGFLVKELQDWIEMRRVSLLPLLGSCEELT